VAYDVRDDRRRRSVVGSVSRLVRLEMVCVASSCIMACGIASGVASAAPTWSKERVVPLLDILPGSDRSFLPGPIGVDGNGDIFIAGYTKPDGVSSLLEVPSGTSTPELLPLDPNFWVNQPLAVDANGDVFQFTGTYTALEELPQGATSWQNVPVSLPNTGLLTGVAVDQNGDVFVADCTSVVELPAGGGPQETLPFTFPLSAIGICANNIAVDGQGDVFVAEDFGAVVGQAVLELPAGSNTPEALPSIGLTDTFGVAADAQGDVYVLKGASQDAGTSLHVIELPAGSSKWVRVPFTRILYGSPPNGIAVQGNTVYVTTDESESADWGKVLELTQNP
jgi:hypothetical protein